MKKKTLALCDSEVAFINHFSEYYSRGRRQPFELRVFTSVDALASFARETSLDILLIAEGLLTEEFRLSIDHILILTEEKACEPNKVSKYQSAPDILKSVVAACPETSSGVDTPVLKPPAQVLVVYSPIGRCFKTTFALTAGEILALDHPTLYVSLEEGCGHTCFLSDGIKGNLSDALYAYRQQASNFIFPLAGMTQAVGPLQVLPPTPCPEELYPVSRDEWVGFLRHLEKNAGYDYLIIDAGCGAGALRPLLEEADLIFLPTLTDNISRAKLDAFRRRLSLWDNPFIEPKLIELTLPTCRLPEYSDRFFERLSVMSFGDYVRKVLRSTLGPGSSDSSCQVNFSSILFPTGLTP